MKAGIVGKFLNFVGLEEVQDEEFDTQEVAATSDWEDEVPQKKRGGLVSLPGSRGFRVVVMHPRTLEDGQAIADQVKGRRPVIVNLDLAEERAGQRLLNFLSGVAYALDGGLRKVGDNIFLVTPNNVEVASEDHDDAPGWTRSLSK
ncbi:cell division protein SepF [Sulfobacillus sp. hq2]|uniref:Cell division protein SepF n=1 Tax=Sulfobacillus thermotolerans TaxID=338644 RepID=A0ABN5H0Y0_9FIRM|nr:cell division protein SepF [Sulfobacillus sp. hq2]AUW94405.1 cell division protein SepF [Sulfobacillus thermotolerans]MCY0909209.1 cell division protein SepF [Sulfobacillus thermotolerans]POB09329.1 cell division protein SepF [Sulfobacillus sp. hq2]